MNNRERLDELRREREAAHERMIWWGLALLGFLAIMVAVLAREPGREVNCRKWDYSDAVIATRRGDRITYTDMNGLHREISGAESSDWNCDK